MEQVNHPTHYQSNDRPECIDEIRKNLGVYGAVCFCLGNAHKYLYRAGAKDNNPAEQDINKADWYVSKAGEYLEDMRSMCCHTSALSFLETRYNKYVQEVCDRM